MVVDPRPRSASPSVLVGQLVLGLTLLGGAGIAGYALVRRPWANRIDAAGFTAFPANPNSFLYHRVAEIGSLPFLLGGIALAIALSIWRDWPRAIACLIGPVVAVIVTEQVAKPLVGRHLSAFGGDSYPSGTVTAAAALVTVIALALPVLLRPIAGLAGLGVIGAVGIAVVGMRWHYPTDAFGGAFVGVGAVLTLDALAHIPRCWIAQRARRERPPEVNRLYATTAADR
jgi:membrane-associated phospholipid phosphatase